MKSNTITAKRIVILRELLGLSQNAFAKKIDVSQGALSQIESGKTKLSLDTLTSLSNSLNVNCNWLVNGNGEIFNEKAHTIQSPKRNLTINLEVGKNGLSIPFVAQEAHAGYINDYNNPDYVKGLDAYRIPGFEKGNYRLFEIEGDSMIPAIFPREIVVTELISIDAIENGSLCIVISKEGIVAKRVYRYEEEKKVLILKSDNPEYKTYKINRKDIVEIGLVRAKITTVFANDGDSTKKRIETLEKGMEQLNEQFKKISDQKNKK